MQIVHLTPNTDIELKKPHPCGGRVFLLMRVGGTCRIRCRTCGRDMEIDRIKLERAIKRVCANEEEH